MAQISPKILKVCPSWSQNTPHQEFNDIQIAIDQIPAYGKYTIRLYDNFMNVPELILTNPNIQVKIDGQGDFGIYFASGNPICTLDSRKTLKFSNITYIRGDAILLRDDSNLYFTNCESVMTRIEMIFGKYTNTYITNTKLYGTFNYPAIAILNSDSKLTVDNSFIKGGYTDPAIYFGADSDGKVKLKDSVLLHYNGVDNYPIQKLSSAYVGLYAYNCVGNEMLCSTEIANYIATNNDNKADPNITF